MMKKLQVQEKIFRKIAGDPNCRHVMNQLIGEYEQKMMLQYQQHYRLKPEILRLYISNFVWGILALHLDWIASSDPVSPEVFISVVQKVVQAFHESLREWQIPLSSQSCQDRKNGADDSPSLLEEQTKQPSTKV